MLFWIQGYVFKGTLDFSHIERTGTQKGYTAILLTLVEYRYSKVGVRCVSGVKRFSNHQGEILRGVTPAPN